MASEGEWESEAGNWLRWARTEGHDAYWYYRCSFLDDIVPAPGPRTIEIGCGEGRVARDLAARGHRVWAVDTSRTLLRAARDADSTGSYALADGAALPFADGCFDVAVAYNALQVVADMPASVGEAARVLVPGGSLCVCIVHPLSDMGRFLGDSPDAPFGLRHSYFGIERVEDTVERDGFTMTFRGWSYALEDYSRALEAADLRVVAIREPRPVGAPTRYERWQRVPMFLNLRATKS